jgi:hypothetical protein
MVVRDPNKGRSSQRKPPPQGQRRSGGPPQKSRPKGEPKWQDPDDVSEVSDAEYEADYEERKSAFYILERYFFSQGYLGLVTVRIVGIDFSFLLSNCA